MTETPQPGWRLWVPAGVLLLAGLALTLPGLGSSELWDPWEPKYAQTAREMADSGQWTVPYYRQDPRLVKPPMTYWLIRTSQSVLGVNELAARLPSALLAALAPAGLALAFALRRRPTEGLLAGAALLTGPQWLLVGRFATPDMPFAAFLGCALALIVALPAIERRGPRFAAAAGSIVSIGLASLVDWPRGLVIPAWAVLVWGALRFGVKGVAGLLVVCGTYYTGQHTYNGAVVVASFGIAGILSAAYLLAGVRVSPLRLAAGALLLVVVVAPWFVAVLVEEPEEMADELLTYKHALNLGETPERHTKPIPYVLLIAALGGLPWTAVAVAGLGAALIRRDDDIAVVLASAWIGGLLFYTMSEAKMGHFYGVLLPAMAGLAGIGLARIASRPRALIPASTALALLAFLVWKRPSRLLETATVKSNLYGLDLATPVLAALAVFAVLLVVAALRRRVGWAVLCLVPAVWSAGAVALWAVPELTPKKSLGPTWQLYRNERGSPDEPLAAYASAKDTIHYYGNNQAVRVKSRRELARFLGEGGVRFVVLPHNKADELPRIGGRFERLETPHPSHRLIRYIPE